MTTGKHMRKIILAAVFLLVALAACGGYENGGYEGNYSVHEYAPLPELLIQIDIATDELLGTFAGLQRTSLGDEGIDLVVWANVPLAQLAVVALEHDWLEETNTFRFFPVANFGVVDMLLPGEGFVIHNYMGLGTMPHRGIVFFDEEKRDTRLFFFQENHAYPEHGSMWVIHEPTIR
jgi:hypothetical protein